MLTIGLTGGIGSGKSIIAMIFSHLEIPIFNADKESGIILNEDPDIRSQLINWFGPDIYKNGKPDRSELARILFNDPELLSGMNQLIHPKVFQQFISWCAGYRNYPYVIHEAAILFESGFYRHMDSTILVTAPEDIRIARVRERDKISEESIRQRIRNQWPDEQKSHLADYVIINDGVSPLIPKILEIHHQLIG